MKKILIVEDDAVNMYLYRKALENAGFNVLMSSTGSDAIDLAKRFNPDMVLLDIFLPGKNGMDIYADMKNDHELQHTPVVFASASFDNDYIVEKTGIGREYVMRKPIIFEHLTNLINRICNNNQQSQKSLSYA